MVGGGGGASIKRLSIRTKKTTWGKVPHNKKNVAGGLHRDKKDPLIGEKVAKRQKNGGAGLAPALPPPPCGNL